ncbi:UNVERIFIED_CONTAM: hypothetical protein FKN15_005415 [Acipenser sinensis]
MEEEVTYADIKFSKIPGEEVTGVPDSAAASTPPACKAVPPVQSSSCSRVITALGAVVCVLLLAIICMGAAIPPVQSSSRSSVTIALGAAVCVLLLAVIGMGITILLCHNHSEPDDARKPLQQCASDLSKYKNDIRKTFCVDPNTGKEALSIEMDSIYTGLQKPSEDVYSTVNQPQDRREGLGAPPVQPSSRSSVIFALGAAVCVLLLAVIGMGITPEQCELCPEKWKKGHNGSCYFISTQYDSWDFANESCSKLGAHLAVIADKEELTVDGAVVRDLNTGNSKQNHGSYHNWYRHNKCSQIITKTEGKRKRENKTQ